MTADHDQRVIVDYFVARGAAVREVAALDSVPRALVTYRGATYPIAYGGPPQPPARTDSEAMWFAAWATESRRVVRDIADADALLIDLERWTA